MKTANSLKSSQVKGVIQQCHTVTGKNTTSNGLLMKVDRKKETKTTNGTAKDRLLLKSGENNNNKNTILKHALKSVSCHRQSVKAGFVRVDPFHDLQAHPRWLYRSELGNRLSWKQTAEERQLSISRPAHQSPPLAPAQRMPVGAEWVQSTTLMKLPRFLC